MATKQAKLHDFSQKISRILGVDYNHQRLSKCRSVAILKDLIRSVLHKTHIISAGSSAEGTYIAGSDIDEMVIIPGILVLRSRDDIPSDSAEAGSYLEMEFRQASAGFCTLLVLKLHDHDIVSGINVKISECLTTNNNQTYLSSEKVCNAMVDIRKITNCMPSMGQESNDIYRHGPCATTNFKGIDDFTDDKGSDLACAISCLSWPDAALEWISRERLHGWPSKELIDRVKKMPCHLLPVGDSESGEVDLEWRFAFVYQERELLWSFSSTNIQCYTLLKALKKEFLPPTLHDEISSYHLKTTMFWLIEKKGPDMWTEENLLQCVVNCIEEYKKCIKSMHLPHFFLRERNLLLHKFKKEETRHAVLLVFTQIQETILQSVCKVFPLFGLPASLEETNTDNSDTLDQISFYLDHLFTVQKYSTLFTDVMIDSVSVASLENLHQALSVTNLDERIIRTLKTFVCIRIAMQVHAGAQTAKDELNKMIWLGTANEIFKDACGLDGMSGHLYYATFDLVRGEVELSKNRVLAFFQTDRCLHYAQNLSRKRTIIVHNGNITQTEEEPYQNIKLLSDEFVALDVLFMSSDLMCLPEALKYECALLGVTNVNVNYCKIHPVAYSYFLLVTASQLQENTKDVDLYLDHLENAVMDTKTGVGRHTALNLLGFAYYKSGKLDKAYTRFCQSLQECKSSKNAAVYHICILVLDVFFSNRERN